MKFFLYILKLLSLHLLYDLTIYGFTIILLLLLN